MQLEDNLEEKIAQSNAISLQYFGLDDLAWKKADALNFILSLMNDKIVILGGDVYKLYQNELKALYDNWCCEPYDNESKKEYILRSKLAALEYISSYPADPNIIFAITYADAIF